MTTLFLNSGNAADAAVTANSDTKWQLGFTLGTNSGEWFTRTIAGPTSGKQLVASTVTTSDTPATPVAYYTKPLQAVTIAGQVTIRLEMYQSADLNAAPCFRLERCAGDGTILSTIVDQSTMNQLYGELTTVSSTNISVVSSATNTVDTALSNGDRLRLTLWIRDASSQGGTGTMASGGYVAFSPDNTAGTGGSHSDANLAETLAQFTGSGGNPTTDPAAVAWSGVAPSVDVYDIIPGSGPPAVAFAGVRTASLALTPPAAVGGTGMFFAVP